MNRRGSGILLHITSLPSPYGIGDFGRSAYEFVDFLKAAHQKFWQILPLTPTEIVHSNSPYHSISAFAGNPILIGLDRLVDEGLLDQEDIAPIPEFPIETVDFPAVVAYKKKIFTLALERFRQRGESADFDMFCERNRSWLDDFSLFVSLKTHFSDKPWTDWPPEFRDRHPEMIRRARQDHEPAIYRQKFLQYLFYKQWYDLKEYCNQYQIELIGDVPIYVVHDSADVWTYPELFNLGPDKRPVTVAGVPPDYFSETGQLWGNPVYRWDLLKERGYDWWIERVRHHMIMFHLVRIDHFRGMVGYWEVGSQEKTAVNGQWVNAPADDFFQVLLKAIPGARVIAEDLGTITPDVTEVMNRFGFPGMKILLFAFGDDSAKNPYLPHNHIKNCVVYTGTHDNNTIKGWFKNETTPEMKQRLFQYLGREMDSESIGWELIRMAMRSVADTAIVPMQDLLNLDTEARMNRPATKGGNWQWRMEPSLLTSSLVEQLGEITAIYGRA